MKRKIFFITLAVFACTLLQAEAQVARQNESLSAQITALRNMLEGYKSYTDERITDVEDATVVNEGNITINGESITEIERNVTKVEKGVTKNTATINTLIAKINKINKNIKIINNTLIEEETANESCSGKKVTWKGTLPAYACSVYTGALPHGTSAIVTDPREGTYCDGRTGAGDPSYGQAKITCNNGKISVKGLNCFGQPLPDCTDGYGG